MKKFTLSGFFLLCVLACSVTSCSIKEKCPAYGSTEVELAEQVSDLG
jgi:hypothetical protein